MIREDTVANWRQAGSRGVILVILLVMMGTGCAGVERPRTDQMVVTENLLQRAGFQQWDVNQETPKRKALLGTLTPGTIVTYRRDGETYYAYGDENSNILYVGNAVAYEKYRSMARGEQLCRRVEGTNSTQFWSCFDEYQKTGGVPPQK